MNEIVKSYGEQARALGRGDVLAPFTEHGFPTRKSEDWRYTPLHSLTRAALAPAANDAAVTIAEIAEHILPDAVARMVFVNGHFRADLSLLPPAGAVTIAPRPRPAQPAPGGRDDVMFALNAALAEHGAVIDIAGKAGLIQILHLATAAHAAIHLRHSITLAEGAQAELAESFVGTDGSYWTNAVSEITLASKAELIHYYQQAESPAATHLNANRVWLAAGSTYRRVELATGAALGRTATDAEIAGPGAHCDLAGAMLAGAGRRLVARSIIDHAAPESDSDELYKCVLAGDAVTAFQGKVIVRAGAQKTNAAQANHNLLLARDAEANTKPELEILANDVKCSHGATVGELNREALFYMQARGLNEAAARQLLVQAFIGEVLDRVSNETVRDRFAAAAQFWLEQQS